MGDFFDNYLKKCIDDKITEAWKNCANYSGFTGAVSDPMVKGIQKIFEDAYVPMKEKTFIEQIVEIENED